jgi:hypothetical protein
LALIILTLRIPFTVGNRTRCGSYGLLDAQPMIILIEYYLKAIKIYLKFRYNIINGEVL